MSLINTELTRWGTALNAYSKLAVRTTVSVGAAIGATCAVVPSMFLDMIPDQALTRSTMTQDLIETYSAWNSLIPISEGFASILAILAVKSGCYAWGVFRTMAKTADDLNPMG